MKLLFLLLAHLSICCFARDLLYKDKIDGSKYPRFGAALATSNNKLIIGVSSMFPGPIFIAQPGKKMELLPPPKGAFIHGLNVAVNKDYILTNGAKGNRPPLTWYIYVYSAVHPHKLVAEIPVENHGFIGMAISEDNTIAMITERSTVNFYSYDGQGAWSQAIEFDIGKHPLYPSRTVTISGDYAAVGMCQYNGEGEGQAEIFERAQGVWKHTQTIKSSEYKFFGAEVAMHKNHLVVAAMNGNKEQHAFVYQRNDASGKWVQEGDLVIPLPTHEAGYNPTFGVDVFIGDEHLIAVSSKLKGTIATKIFKEVEEGKWAEHVNLKADPMDGFLQQNAAVRFGGKNWVFTGRVSIGGHKSGEVYIHDLSKIRTDE